MGNVSLLRLDQTGGAAPGNKSFKLQAYLAQARKQGIRRLVSFGGPWSNHLHALAAIGHQLDFETVGIVRGDECRTESAMLADARRWGMHIVAVARSEYRQRNEHDYQRQVTETFAPCLLIPEGGSSATGASGCKDIANIIERFAPPFKRVILPVGTGTTLAGLVASLTPDYQLVGVSALKGATDQQLRVQTLLGELHAKSGASWRILDDFHCGGFARVNSALREFILAFEAVQGVELEPVYTAKMLFGIHQLLQRGEWASQERLLAIHTGGMQGRRGYSWLSGTGARAATV
jgi:1-aminocyclopropane-1-carboxylate deaminase